MSVPEWRILTKKTSKHPKESNTRQSYEEVIFKQEQNTNKHIDIFSMPDIFPNEPNTNATPQKHLTESDKHTVVSQKSTNSITEMKRIIDRKRKKHNRPRLLRKDLSLIQQSEGEYNNTSSSNDSILNESSIQDIETSSLSYSEKSISDDKMNEGFIDELSEDDVMNKTVLMYKKKVTQKHQSPKLSQELAQDELEQLYEFAKKNSIDTLHKLYQEAKLSEMKFLLILEMKKQDEKLRKEDKFNQNLSQIQNVANVINENYQLLHQKLYKDTLDDDKKLRTYTKNIIKIHNEKIPKEFNLPNPTTSKIQLQALQIMAQQKAKQNFLTILQNMHQTFQLQYNKCIQKIDFIKNAKQNFSENLIFTEIKQLIKTNKQIYLFFEQSLINDKTSQKSLISLHARKHYLELLTEKFQKQLVPIEEFKAESLKKEVIKLLREKNVTQISEELSVKLLKTVKKRLSEQLHKTKQQFLQHIVWLRMIREKGELNEGRIFRQAVWVMSNNQPLNIPIIELRQKYLVWNYKFYRRNVFKNISAQFETIKQLFQSSNKKRQVLREKIEKRNKQHFEDCLNNLEKKVECFRIHEQKDHNLNVFIMVNSLKPKGINQNEDCFQILQRSLQKVGDLQQKTDQLLLISVTHKKFQKKLLIPPKRVVIYDFRVKQTDVLTQNCSSKKKGNLMDRLESRYQVKHSTDDIKCEVEKGHLPLEKHCLNVKYQMLQMEKQGNALSARSQSENKYTEQQQRHHFERVYELISNNQVHLLSNEEEKEQEETYCPPTQSEMEWSCMAKISFAHQKQKTKKNSPHYHHSLSQKQILSSSQDVSYQSYQSPDLKSHLSVFEIQEACKMFTKEFYFNPNLTSQLQLNEEQFYFLMSPDYRRNFLEKKLKDQYLEERILNIIRNNPLSTISPEQQVSSPYNPINHIIQTDSEFQQRIQQYQNKVVKSRHLSLHYDHSPQQQNDNCLWGGKIRSYSLFDQYEDRMFDTQARKSILYFTSNKSDFDTVASTRVSSQMW